MITLSLGSFGTIRVPSTDSASMLLPSAAEMSTLDKLTILSGISALELMERAGAVVAGLVSKLVPASGSVVIVCGSGNNGGDGVVVARLLSTSGYRVTTVVAQAEKYSDGMVEQLRRFPSVFRFGGDGDMSSEELLSTLKDADIVIDALLGTGAKAAPRGVVQSLVQSISSAAYRSAARRRIIAMDIPSGLDPDTGALHEVHVRADITVAIQFVKRGMLQFPGREACGDIVVAPIGIERSPVQPVQWSAVEANALPPFPGRSLDAHKGNIGHVFVIGGSRGMSGAAILASLSALRTGAGLVTRVTASSWPVFSVAPVECMTRLVSGEHNSFGEQDAKELFEGDQVVTNVADAIVLGPGLSLSSDATRFVTRALESLLQAKRPLVLDADALTIIAAQYNHSKAPFVGAPVIMTPHPGEAARLLGCTSQEVQRDRFAAVQAIAERYGCVTLLKGAGTLVYGAGEGRLVPRGTPFLATAGSGDVLGGIIATLLARGLSPLDAAALGAYIHARAGESATRVTGGVILASEIASAIPAIVGALERGVG